MGTLFKAKAIVGEVSFPRRRRVNSVNFSSCSRLFISSRLFIGSRLLSSSGFLRACGGLFFASIFVLIGAAQAHALGVGAAETDSYIGDNLSVRIPLFNVANPNTLTIEFDSPQFDGERQPKVTSVLDRSNSQLAVKLTTETAVNEPYLNFSLELVDNNANFSKEFIVLLNLSPTAGARGATRPVNNYDGNGFTNSGVISSNLGSASADGSLMGPYDYAQPGNIPAKFGAVLDGQSLWRVARRINDAMGVSRSQMIWALYQANPKAFTAKNVQSLKAGSYLTIPDQSIVRAVSHEQAKAYLSALSSGRAINFGAEVAAADTEKPQKQAIAIDEFVADSPFNNADGSNNANGSAEAQNNPFQVTGIDEVGPNLGAAGAEASQQIIASLTETVGNLSQQLVRKDQQIEFLQAQVSELKTFISQDDVATAPVISQFEANSPQSAPVPTDTGGSAVGSELNESSSIASTPLQTSSFSLWQWVLLALATLALVALLMRERVTTIWRSLNLFGSDERVQFEDVASTMSTRVYSRTEAAFETEPLGQGAAPKVRTEPQVTKDYSSLSAVENDVEIDGISYLDLADDDGSYQPNEVLDLVVEEADATPEEDLSFGERFNSLLEEKDFEFARELLDFARYNEINDERYHCERLRLLEKMCDEDAFYKYYYEIEEKIPGFPQNLQTEISQLVVQLAHH